MKKNLSILLSLLSLQIVAQVELNSTGTSTAYLISYPANMPVYQKGFTFTFKAHVACGASPTINVNSVGALTIKNTAGSDLAANDIRLGQEVTLTYDGVFFQMTSASGNIVAGGTGSGTLNYIPKWTPNGITLGNSLMFDDGTNIGIGVASPGYTLDIRQGAAPAIQIVPSTNLDQFLRLNGGGGVNQIIESNYNLYLRTLATDAPRHILLMPAGSGNVGIGTASPAQALDISGSLNISGSARRIYGDFSNATHANRTLFQTSTANNSTVVGFIPNGTGVVSQLNVYNNSDLTAALCRGAVGINASALFIDATALNSGTVLPITFQITGSEKMRVHTDGNIGIGTTVPNATLDVVTTNACCGTNGIGVTGNVNDVSIGIKNSTASGHDWRILSSGTGSIVGPGNFNIEDFNAGAARLSINSSGNVGIGTTSPGDILHVESATHTRVRVASSAGTNAVAGLQLSAKASGASKAWYIDNRGGVDAPNNRLAFFDPTSLNERFTILDGGNVGIGTIAPNSKLSITNNIATGFLDNYSEYQQILYDAGTAASSYGFGIKGSTIVFNSGVGAYSFDRGGVATSLLIDVNGNVGIGTTAPGGLLEVSGTSAAAYSTAGIYGNPRIRIVNLDNTTANNAAALAFVTADAAGTIASAAGISTVFLNHSTNAVSSDITFQTKNAGTLGEKVRFTYNGNVGIGSTSPLAKLDVSGDFLQSGNAYHNFGTTVGSTGFGIRDNAGTMQFKNNAGAWADFASSAAAAGGWTDGGTNVYLTTGTDNVGIGTTVPSQVLSIASVGSTTGTNVQFSNTSALAIGNQITQLFTFNTGIHGQFGMVETSTATSGLADFAWFTWNGAAYGERMRLTSSGNFGIGSMTPGEKLDVVGNIKASSTVTAAIHATTTQTLTDGATITWTATSGTNAAVVLGGNRTLAIAGAPAGSYGTLVVKQDGTGNRTLTLPAGSKVNNAATPGVVVLSTAANSIDILTYYYDGTTYFWNVGLNFR